MSSRCRHLKINSLERKSLLQIRSFVLLWNLHLSRSRKYFLKYFQPWRWCHQQLSHSSQFIMYCKFIWGQNSSNWSAPVSKPVRRGHASRLLLCCVQVGEVAPRGQSVGRHHLVVYEPTESRVSTGFNGLLYSLPVRKLGKQRAVVCQSRVQGQTPHRIPTWTCRGGTW